MSRDTRNQLRRVFLKELKKIILIKNKVYENLKIEEFEMAKQAKFKDISIPIFDGVNYLSWKFWLMTLLEYKECKEQTQRKVTNTNKSNKWLKKD